MSPEEVLVIAISTAAAAVFIILVFLPRILKITTTDPVEVEMLRERVEILRELEARLKDEYLYCPCDVGKIRMPCANPPMIRMRGFGIEWGVAEEKQLRHDERWLIDNIVAYAGHRRSCTLPGKNA